MTCSYLLDIFNDFGEEKTLQRDMRLIKRLYMKIIV